MKRRLAWLHRWLSLAIAAVWLLQAATGVAIVFHWELSDGLLRGAHRPTDLVAIERRLEQLAPAGSGRMIDSVWTTAGAPDRWDVTIESPAGGETVRIDGAGDVLQRRTESERWRDGGLIDTLVLLHQTLLGGSIGGWILGISGILLMSNLVLALVIAWPRAGTWVRTLSPPRRGRRAARLYGWHRGLGLLVATPALVLVTAGVVREFGDGFDRVIGAPVTVVPAIPPHGRDVGFARAVSAALTGHPRTRLAGIDFPTATDAVWRVRLLAPGEARRAYGTTTAWIDGNDGRVVARSDAATVPFARWLADLVYPVHTGEIAGLPGRLAVMATGAWLASMIVIGTSLWLARRRTTRARA